MKLARLFNRPVLQRIFNRNETEPGPVVLDRKRIFILPTRHGLVFAGMLLLMLIGAINYNLSLGFVLIFLLASMAMVSILHSYRNLAQLRVHIGKVTPIFAGQQANFSVCLENTGATVRYAIGIQRMAQPASFTDIASNQAACLPLIAAAEHRGILRLGRFVLFTTFPFGLFRAWSPMNLEASCVVYPRPENGIPLPPATDTGGGDNGNGGEGREDFSGLRPYHLGDSPHHVDWKAAARERGLLTKQFTGHSSPKLWLDWDGLTGLGTEARLSRLCGWVLLAHAEGTYYGLRLPGINLEPALNDDHRRRCLEALALFGLTE